VLLEDILESIELMEDYIKDISREDFMSSMMYLDLVVRRLEVVGEAVNNLSEEIKEKYSDIPWHEIGGMRNKLIHEYFGVDKDLVWETAKKDVPNFKKNIQEILKEYD
jgi:uncharacterized protein with HEPN domain